MAHQADAKSMLDSRGLYTGATVHGVNPLLLVEKIIRERIFESLYWKEQAFGLNGNSPSLCALALPHPKLTPQTNTPQPQRSSTAP
jgi:hypothetical protein